MYTQFCLTILWSERKRPSAASPPPAVHLTCRRRLVSLAVAPSEFPFICTLNAPHYVYGLIQISYAQIETIITEYIDCRDDRQKYTSIYHLTELLPPKLSTNTCWLFLFFSCSKVNILLTNSQVTYSKWFISKSCSRQTVKSYSNFLERTTRKSWVIPQLQVLR